MRLRTPLTVAVGRKLRICIVARFSTDEQRKRRRSNAAQISWVKKQIEQELARAGITNYEFITIEDEAISGEIKERPGITKLRELIAGRKIDVIICEDSSRLYRNYAFCYDIVAAAYDNGIRTICLGDYIDTDEPDWVQRLQEAQAHHCASQAHLRTRLARAFDDLWEMKAAVGPLRPGFLRTATKEATYLSDAEGPFFDSLDPAHSKHIVVAFKLFVRRRDPQYVAEYLAKKKVPLCNGKTGAWHVRQVLAMIRNPVYRGKERYRVTHTKQVKLTGDSKQLKSDAAQIWWRDMPHLRIVTDGLWHAANEVIDSRQKCKGPPTGINHPHFGVPRDSKTPMSGLLRCGICKGKMYCIGTSYRCQCVHSQRGQAAGTNVCWNHATCPRVLTNASIFRRVFQELSNSEDKLDVLVDELARQLADRKDMQAEERRLQREIESRRNKCRNLSKALEGTGRKPKLIVEEMLRYEDEVEKMQLQLEDVRSELEQVAVVPDRSQLQSILNETVAALPGTDRRARAYLKDLIDGAIEVFPYRLLRSNRIVLRAHFTLNLVNICPEELRQGLRRELKCSPDATVLEVPCIVDLFDAPKYVRHALSVHRAYQGARHKDVIHQFPLSEPTIKRSRRLGEAMDKLQVTDPYVRLDLMPEQGSRWHRYNTDGKNKRRAS